MTSEQRRETMGQSDWEDKFEQQIKEYLIDLPEGYYDERLGFNDPNQLNEIFSELEEKNLYLILCSQDLEQSVEQENQTTTATKKSLEAEISKIVQNKAKLEQKVRESQ
jgi:hypothetical protein